jgi:hypothetical protein
LRITEDHSEKKNCIEIQSALWQTISPEWYRIGGGDVRDGKNDWCDTRVILARERRGNRDVRRRTAIEIACLYALDE